jgi:preprotein translocase subunit SecG
MPDKDLPLKGVPGRAVLAVVDKAVATRWEDAVRVAREAPGASPDERSAAIAKQFTRQLAGLGAAAGGTAALPGVGTIAAIGTTTAELAAFAFRASEMVLAIGAAHGHTAASVEQRKAWVLSVLAFGDDAAEGYSSIVSSLGGAKALAASQGGSGWFQTVNRYLGRKLIARFGAREGAAALGRLLPFGIGAAFGGGTNFFMARGIAKDATRLFRQLPSGLGALPPPPPRPAGLLA